MLSPWVRQILITLQGNIPVDLASTEHLSSSDAFRFLLADLPFLSADFSAAPFSLPFSVSNHCCRFG
jgi:hypothetical protein